MLNSGQNRRSIVPCDIEIWRKNKGRFLYATLSFAHHFVAIGES